ncbi:MAG: hypothetical protein CME62_06815 [Halobacteriovoraceae bacterium]|nr:hypothetical protein [Halobacteriovoraceae bacterium]|tara:strand:+ start:1481 stop:1723 length:243 start_codon:yes stop_codon:yes gene_type:complete
MERVRMQDIRENGGALPQARNKFDTMKRKASIMSKKAVANSRDAADKSVRVIKDYPLHSALTAGAIGLIAGLIGGRFSRS